MHVTRTGLIARPRRSRTAPRSRSTPRCTCTTSRRSVSSTSTSSRPTTSRRTPRPGDTIARATSPACRSSEETLLTQMNSLVDSVDSDRPVDGGRRARHDVPRHGEPAAAAWSTPGQHFVDEAAATPGRHHRPARHRADGAADPGRRTRRTSRPSPSDLADLTGTLRTSDKDIRTVLQGGPPAVREVNSLLKGLRADAPGLPVQPGDHQPGADHQPPGARADARRLPARDRGRASPARPGDGYGHINLQFNNTVPPVHQGLQAAVASGARPPTPPTRPIYPAQCKSGDPQEMRGFRNAPAVGRLRVNGPQLPGRAVRCEDRSGRHRQRTAAGRRERRRAAHVFGDDGWKWMLMGPEAAGD